jgi:hypothetical protein
MPTRTCGAQICSREVRTPSLRVLRNAYNLLMLLLPYNSIFVPALELRLSNLRASELALGSVHRAGDILKALNF